MLRQRTFRILLAALVLAAPAALLRVFCVGHSCDEPANASAQVPFCSLPADVRTSLADGFREGRSPDLLAVSADPTSFGGSAFAGPGPAWPRLKGIGDVRVPLVLYGTGIAQDATIPDGTTLDSIAPTLARVAALTRPHPEVRSGAALDGVTTGATSDLLVEIVLTGVGSTDVEGGGWPQLESLLERGPSTSAARAGSLPLDPATVLTTIGTGGLPRQHGITGTLLRNDSGRLVRAYGDGAPVSVIATLADDLDETFDQDARIALIAPDRSDRGLIGGNWYIDVDEDDLVIDEGRPAPSLQRLITNGYGDDDVPDLIGVVIDGGDPHADDLLGRVADAVPSDATVAVTTTGPFAGDGIPAAKIARVVERGRRAGLVEATTPGGLFLDQATLAARNVSEDVVLEKLRDMKIDKQKVFDDAFAAIAVSFARYC